MNEVMGGRDEQGTHSIPPLGLYLLQWREGSTPLHPHRRATHHQSAAGHAPQTNLVIHPEDQKTSLEKFPSERILWVNVQGVTAVVFVSAG